MVKTNDALILLKKPSSLLGFFLVRNFSQERRHLARLFSEEKAASHLDFLKEEVYR